MASSNAITNDLLARYILGELSKEERENMETIYLRGKQVHRQRLAVEQELFDAYVSGDLSDNRRRQFEKIFGQSPDFQSKLAFARARHAALNEEPERKRQLVSALGIRLAVAAAVLLLVAVGLFLVNRSNSNTPKSTLPVVTYRISPSLGGANQSPNLIRLPNYSAIVQLRIPLNEPHTSPCLVIIETLEGEGKFSVPAQDSAENPSILSVDLTPTSLQPGNYILSVVLESSLKPIADFSVRITQ
ncbi:MAG TPA: hypothetical protein VH351_23795 [Bryobacteraceae bacterium]|jgi:hypothetical protein|nr:hypothetical protein [Bryobacteraceae bacterium]